MNSYDISFGVERSVVNFSLWNERLRIKKSSSHKYWRAFSNLNIHTYRPFLLCATCYMKCSDHKILEWWSKLTTISKYSVLPHGGHSRIFNVGLKHFLKSSHFRDSHFCLTLTCLWCWIYFVENFILDEWLM